MRNSHSCGATIRRRLTGMLTRTPPSATCQQADKRPSDVRFSKRNVRFGPTTDNLSSPLGLPTSPLGVTMACPSSARGYAMAGEVSGYVGNIPQHYDRNLGPLLFTDYAADIARRVATLDPRRVLETAAGTGIVTRALRDALPAGADLTATDLNGPMLDIAPQNFAQAKRLNSVPPMQPRCPSPTQASTRSPASSA